MENDYIMYACGHDEFAQYFFMGCLFRWSLPDHMVEQYFNSEAVTFHVPVLSNER